VTSFIASLWGAGLGVIMTFAYLGAFVDPEGNLEDLPIGRSTSTGRVKQHGDLGLG
jgi:hypothetical protein